MSSIRQHTFSPDLSEPETCVACGQHKQGRAHTVANDAGVLWDLLRGGVVRLREGTSLDGVEAHFRGVTFVGA